MVFVITVDKTGKVLKAEELEETAVKFQELGKGKLKCFGFDRTSGIMLSKNKGTKPLINKCPDIIREAQNLNKIDKNSVIDVYEIDINADEILKATVESKKVKEVV